MEGLRGYFVLEELSFQGAGVYLGCVLIPEQSFEMEGKWLMKGERCSGAKVESIILLLEPAGG